MDATQFLAVTPAMRKRLAATCEALIALLDEIDGDTDDEPALGWTAIGQNGTDDDREEQCEDEAAQCDDEGAEH